MSDGLTEYEEQRLQLIARNRARLLDLGIPSAVEGLSALVATSGLPRKKKKEKTREERWVPAIQGAHAVMHGASSVAVMG